jgi:hypothetical protein
MVKNITRFFVPFSLINVIMICSQISEQSHFLIIYVVSFGHVNNIIAITNIILQNEVCMYVWNWYMHAEWGCGIGNTKVPAFAG